MKVNRKTILSTAAVLGVAALVAGGTIAYFSDKETATNTFTVGDVNITLNEKDFAGDPLVSPQDLAPGNNENAVPKVATVTVNEDSQSAWVWVEMLIPEGLYNSKTDEQESNNALHYNQFLDYLVGYENKGENNSGRSGNANAKLMRDQYQADHEWSVFKYIGDTTIGTGADAKTYAVLRTTHKSIVAPGEETSPALAQLYMDDDVHYEDTATGRKMMIPAHGEWGGTGKDNYTATYPEGEGKWVEYDGDWEVIVNAYAMQTVGFATVDDAVANYR